MTITANTSARSVSLHGARLTAVLPLEAQSLIDWVTCAGSKPDAVSVECDWLLAHCTDGVTWGRQQDNGWQCASSIFPDLSPGISRKNLLELRLFGPRGELLLWRAEGGADPVFRGRWLVDEQSEPCRDSTNPLRPHGEDRILLGNRFLDARDGFTRLGDGTGKEQAVPLDCRPTDFGSEQRPTSPLRLSVRNYFETDTDNGAVRVAASRLVNLSIEHASQGAHS